MASPTDSGAPFTWEKILKGVIIQIYAIDIFWVGFRVGMKCPAVWAVLNCSYKGINTSINIYHFCATHDFEKKEKIWKTSTVSHEKRARNHTLLKYHNNAHVSFFIGEQITAAYRASKNAMCLSYNES